VTVSARRLLSLGGRLSLGRISSWDAILRLCGILSRNGRPGFERWLRLDRGSSWDVMLQLGGGLSRNGRSILGVRTLSDREIPPGSRRRRSTMSCWDRRLTQTLGRRLTMTSRRNLNGTVAQTSNERQTFSRLTLNRQALTMHPLSSLLMPPSPRPPTTTRNRSTTLSTLHGTQDIHNPSIKLQNMALQLANFLDQLAHALFILRDRLPRELAFFAAGGAGAVCAFARVLGFHAVGRPIGLGMCHFGMVLSIGLCLEGCWRIEWLRRWRWFYFGGSLADDDRLLLGSSGVGNEREVGNNAVSTAVRGCTLRKRGAGGLEDENWELLSVRESFGREKVEKRLEDGGSTSPC